jgi:methionine biosynthesis protein MetW
MSARCAEALGETHRLLFEIVRALPRAQGEPRLLDVGCWDGETTQRFAQAIGARGYGLEVFPEQAARARSRGIEVSIQDLESQPFPWPDETMDVVIANQVLEHLKNVWLPMSEIFRVLRVGGRAIIGVPNLASLHNRVLLALGRQPTAIRTFGPHVRGFTLRELRDFVARGGGFEVERALAAGFYPLPASWGRVPVRIWPDAGVIAIVVARKTRAIEPPWLAWVQDELEHGIQTYWQA